MKTDTTLTKREREFYNLCAARLSNGEFPPPYPTGMRSIEEMENNMNSEKELTIRMELRLLAKAQEAFEAMPSAARVRAFNWFKSKYEKEWPPHA